MNTNKITPDKVKPRQWLVMGFTVIILVSVLYMILQPCFTKGDKVGNGQLLTDVLGVDVVKPPEDKLPVYKGSDLVELGEERVDSQLQRLYDEVDSSDDCRTSHHQDDGYPYEEGDDYQSSEDMYTQFVREQEEQDQIARLQEQIDGSQRERKNSADEREYLTQLGRIKDRRIAVNDIYSNAYRRVGADPAPAPESSKDPNVPASFEVVGVKTVDPSIVSTPSQPGRDVPSQQAYEAPLQNHFTVSVGSFRSEIVAKDMVRAIISETKTVKLGDEIKMRLMESIQVDTVVVPKGTTIVAKPNLTNNRLQPKVTSIEYRERIIGVDLSAFDPNGQEGLYVPATAEAVGFKTLGEGLVGTVTGGTSTQQSGKDQTLTNVSNGLIHAGGNYMCFRASEVRVKVKVGHQSHLYDESREN